MFLGARAGSLAGAIRGRLPACESKRKRTAPYDGAKLCSASKPTWWNRSACEGRASFLFRSEGDQAGQDQDGKHRDDGDLSFAAHGEFQPEAGFPKA